MSARNEDGNSFPEGKVEMIINLGREAKDDNQYR
jgi:hypothetical protein